MLSTPVIVSAMSAETLMLESVAGQVPGTAILRLTGPLTLNTLFEFQNMLRADPPQALVLDLTGVPYMDSSGMGAIINYYVSCERHGRKLVVAGVNGRVLELFRMTRVDSLLVLTPTVAEGESRLAARA